MCHATLVVCLACSTLHAYPCHVTTIFRGSHHAACCHRLINDGEQLQCGPKVISDRIAVEKAGYVSQNQTFGPVGAAIRYTNYTAHPSTTPGALQCHDSAGAAALQCFAASSHCQDAKP